MGVKIRRVWCWVEWRGRGRKGDLVWVIMLMVFVLIEVENIFYKRWREWLGR